MIKVAAHNIISPLGCDSASNFEAVLAGETRLRPHAGAFGLPEDFCGSLLDRPALETLIADELPDAAPAARPDLHLFERLCILSAQRALKSSGIDPAAADAVFVLSTTKGNVSLLEQDPQHPDAYLAASAAKIAGYFDNPNTPVVVSNACISGVCAQITAARLLQSGRYRHAVVVGCDLLSRFIVSGFQSFKALSTEPCKPFDADRTGLNLGEAAATLVLTADPQIAGNGWHIAAMSIHNDANHISGPSRTGEGSYRVLADLLRHVSADDLYLVNPHGTATPYNDEMESIALHRAGLDRANICGLKGYYGHTLGAAGIVETIISMLAASARRTPATLGYTTPGTTHPLNISTTPQGSGSGSTVSGADSPRLPGVGSSFIKLLSGFGGCNAGIAYTAQPSSDTRLRDHARTALITPEGVWLDGGQVSAADITGLYREQVGNYPKFFKMDQLCKLGFMAAELLLRDLDADTRQHMAVALFNRNASLVTDRNYQATLAADNYFPSPALFVYTLANIVTGEIAIRHKIYGETSMYVLAEPDTAVMDTIARTTLDSTGAPALLYGWLDYDSPTDYRAELKLIINHQS